MAEKPTYEELENRVNELMVELRRFAKVEAELNRSLRFTESLLSGIPTPIFIKDAQGRYQGCNPSFTEFMGVTAQNLRGKTVQELWPSEYAEVYHQKDLELMLHPKRQIYEFEVKDKDGNTRPVIFYKNVFHDEHGNVAGIVGGFVDITEVKRSEVSLKKSERKYRQLFERSSDAIFVVDKSTGRYLDANPAAEELTGFPLSDLKKLTTHEVTPYGAKKRLKTIASHGGKTNFEEVLYIRKDGSKRIARLSVVALDDENVYGIAHDITDSKRAEEALRESERKYKSLANNLNVGIYRNSIGSTGRFIEANPAIVKMFGYDSREEFLKVSVSDLYKNPEDRFAYNTKLLRENEIRNEELQLRKKDGTTFVGSVSAVVVKDEKDIVKYYDGIIEDITERKLAEEALRESEEKLHQAEKMEAIGTLAGGIAHDFNNILSAILGYSELALADLPFEASIRNKLEAIHSSGERARDLVSQILAFSRKDEQVRSPVSLHLILKDALKILRPAIPTTIEIQAQITSKCRIFGDPSRVHQVIMNLCTNAYQAMLETGGTLKITLSHEELEGKTAALAQVPAGFYGKLVISDTGVGIPSKNVERIFDPYFTTKEKGKGTGLGLAAVHGICKSHGGSILVESEIEKGTKFTVYLPLTLEGSGAGKQADFQLPAGNERILLVDDEQNIREIEKEMLEMQGYNVTAKNNAQEALKLFSEKPERFDLVITDMTMPYMTGDRFAEELRKIRSDIPIILSTGYSELMSKEKAKSLGIKGFLMKPFTTKELSSTIRKVLNDNEDANSG
jgi:PAS domain S-box-containing protein